MCSVSLVLIFKILPMLMECSILLMGNTVEWQGGDIYRLSSSNHYNTHALLKVLKHFLCDVFDLILIFKHANHC